MASTLTIAQLLTEPLTLSFGQLVLCSTATGALIALVQGVAEYLGWRV